MSVPPSDEIHPFLKGNFAPVTDEYVDYQCEVMDGRVPRELIGGQYVRNGGNPVYPPEKGRHYHWQVQILTPLSLNSMTNYSQVRR